LFVDGCWENMVVGCWLFVVCKKQELKTFTYVMLSEHSESKHLNSKFCFAKFESLLNVLEEGTTLMVRSLGLLYFFIIQHIIR
jgi:hypothetical protein